MNNGAYLIDENDIEKAHHVCHFLIYTPSTVAYNIGLQTKRQDPWCSDVQRKKKMVKKQPHPPP